jgi:hypothetical protein
LVSDPTGRRIVLTEFPKAPKLPRLFLPLVPPTTFARSGFWAGSF